MAPIPRDTMAAYDIESMIDSSTQLEESEWDDSESEVDCSEYCFESSYFGGANPPVRFSMAIKRTLIPSLDEFTDKEKKSCWYTPEEKKKMSVRHNKMVARYESGKPLKGNMTYRGLECWTVEGGASLDDSIARCVDAVMDEQDAQWASRIEDSDRIAATSRAVTLKSLERALQIAQQDEMESKMAWLIPDHDDSNDADSVTGYTEIVAQNIVKRYIKKSKTKKESQIAKRRNMQLFTEAFLSSRVCMNSERHRRPG